MDIKNVQVQNSAPDTYNQLRRKIEEKGPDAFAKMLEGVLLQQMIQEMNKTMLSNGMFGNSHQSQMFQGLFTQALADNITEQGGLGLADVIKGGLTPQQRPNPLEKKNFEIDGDQLNDFRLMQQKMHTLEKTNHIELKEEKQ